MRYMYMYTCTYHIRCLGEANGYPALCLGLQSEVKVAAVFTVGVDPKKEVASTTGQTTTLRVAERNPIG